MLAKVNSSAIIGLNTVPVEVEVDVASESLPSLAIIVLPDKAVEEAKDRVKSAIKNAGAKFPAIRISLNLFPINLPREGALYDLSIALGILLLASEQIKIDVSKILKAGRIIADFADLKEIKPNHIAEALQYRLKIDTI